jgi:hypothetical protein
MEDIGNRTMHAWEKTRRNHGLEHATIALLAQRGLAGHIIAGNSTPGGFFIYGDVPEGEVERSANDALAKMRNGEAELAVSPFCGTNIVVGGALATLGVAMALQTAGRTIAGWQRAFSNAVLGLVMARPLGKLVQRHITTSADVEGMEVHRIRRCRLGGLTVHRVSTTFSKNS